MSMRESLRTIVTYPVYGCTWEYSAGCYLNARNIVDLNSQIRHETRVKTGKLPIYHLRLQRMWLTVGNSVKNTNHERAGEQNYTRLRLNPLLHCCLNLTLVWLQKTIWNSESTKYFFLSIYLLLMSELLCVFSKSIFPCLTTIDRYHRLYWLTLIMWVEIDSGEVWDSTPTTLFTKLYICPSPSTFHDGHTVHTHTHITRTVRLATIKRLYSGLLCYYWT